MQVQTSVFLFSFALASQGAHAQSPCPPFPESNYWNTVLVIKGDYNDNIDIDRAREARQFSSKNDRFNWFLQLSDASSYERGFNSKRFDRYPKYSVFAIPGYFLNISPDDRRKVLPVLLCHQRLGWPLSRPSAAAATVRSEQASKPSESTPSSIQIAKEKGYGALIDLAYSRGCAGATRPANAECEKIAGMAARDAWHEFRCNLNPDQLVCRDVEKLNEAAGSDRLYLPSLHDTKSVESSSLTDSAARMLRMATDRQEWPITTSPSKGQPSSNPQKCSAIDAYGRQCVSVAGYTSVKHTTFGPTFYKVKFRMSESCTGSWFVRATTDSGVKLETGISPGNESELSCSSQGKDACSGISSTETSCR